MGVGDTDLPRQQCPILGFQSAVELVFEELMFKDRLRAPGSTSPELFALYELYKDLEEPFCLTLTQQDCFSNGPAVLAAVADPQNKLHLESSLLPYSISASMTVPVM